MNEVPEEVYLDAARADAAVYFADDPAQPDDRFQEATAERIARRPDFRAAVDFAFAAGQRAKQVNSDDARELAAQVLADEFCDEAYYEDWARLPELNRNFYRAHADAVLAAISHAALLALLDRNAAGWQQALRDLDAARQEIERLKLLRKADARFRDELSSELARANPVLEAAQEFAHGRYDDDEFLAAVNTYEEGK